MEQLQDFLQQLKSQIRPSDVIGRKVKLLPGGMGRQKGLCPFHNEKTPSFYVMDENNSYHCFGCGAHGDIITFIQETNGLSFIEAVEYLAKEAGLTMPTIRKQSEQEVSQRETLANMMQFALNYFIDNLTKSENYYALNYFKQRGLDPNLIKDYQLGFAPKGNKLLSFFPKTQHENLIACGLAQKNDKGQIYDLFQDRVIFPIFNHKNEPIAFGGRVLDDRLPKYLNSPETKFFKKKSTLYNYNNARKSAVKKQEIIVTEGYMDVLALIKYGFPNCVAPLGTAFSQEHLFNLWHIVKTPIICLDGDQAGLKAMSRIAHLALPHLKPGYSLKFISLPINQDPDDFLKENGATSLKKLITNSVNLSDMILKLTIEKIGTNSPESKAELEKNIYGLISEIKNKTVRKQYNYFAKNALWELFRFQAKKPKNNPVKIPKISSSSELILAESEIVYLIIKHPSLLDNETIVEELCDYEFSNQELQNIQDFLIKTELRESKIIHQKLLDNKMLISKFLKDRLLNLKAYNTDSDSLNLENLWLHTQKLYFLAKMRIDYRNFLNSSDPSLAEKALKILDNIKELEISINNYNNDF